jgi:hypothetical protein
MAKYKFLNNIKTGVVERIEITGDELKELEARETAWDSKANKLKEIKVNRLQCLQETDWYSNSDVTMPENIKTWRQTLRDITKNFTTESEYDELLVVDTDKTSKTFGKLTHSIWSKP